MVLCLWIAHLVCSVFAGYIYFRFILVCDFVEKISNDSFSENEWKGH